MRWVKNRPRRYLAYQLTKRQIRTEWTTSSLSPAQGPVTAVMIMYEHTGLVVLGRSARLV